MKVYALVVLYNPDVKRLKHTITVLHSLNIFLCFIDNTEDRNRLVDLTEFNVVHIKNHTNYGIAKAQNIGISFALGDGADAMLFFDQDTYLETKSIATLIHNYIMSSHKYKVFAPNFINEALGFSYPLININSLGILKKIYLKDISDSIIKVDIVISSGMLVSSNVFEVVGLMDEKLFIDYVDTEWCLRCKDKSVSIFVCKDSVVKHSIGNANLRFWGVTVPVHSAQRRYYRVRNAFYLIKLKHIPRLMILREVILSFIHQMVLYIHSKDSSYLRIYVESLKDALKGAYGKKT
ncbi:MAG: glycosyltransferase family 2 protein [Campylobacterales bacterium]|nr:glycosyltransferase family 2 protein [Campylobacterales bacterium]